MTNIKTLEEKISELEKRVKVLEDKLTSPADAEESEFMEALYNKAKFLAQSNKLSVIFLQRKLMIDLPRAKKLLVRLQSEGIIG